MRPGCAHVFREGPLPLMRNWADPRWTVRCFRSWRALSEGSESHCAIFPKPGVFAKHYDLRVGGHFPFRPQRPSMTPPYRRSAPAALAKMPTHWGLPSSACINR